MASKKKKAKKVSKKSARPPAKKQAAKKSKKPARASAKKSAPPKKKAPGKASRPSKARSALPKPVISPKSGAIVAGYGEILLGEVEDYFAHANAIAITLKDSLSVGDLIRVRGHTTNLTQAVASLQIDRKPIRQAKKGDGVGIQVNERCRKGDKVFRVAKDAAAASAPA